MAGLIPQSFVQDLVSRVDIIDVVQSRISLKKKGKDYWACCPFHGEKTPSFSVSQSKQFYKCFGCGVSGNVVSFVMEYDRIDFPTAIEALAERVGIEVPREQGSDPQAGLRQELYGILAEASTHFQNEIRGPDSGPAIAYLKKRGLSGETAKAFGIGYAPPGWDRLLNALGTSAKRVELLETGGMLIRKEGKSRDGREHYDRFRERLMFPIRDARGRVIGFGGRVLGNDEPKYLNSPETPVFHKGSELYGLFEAKQHKVSQTRMLLVEGYMDVVALAQAGIPNAVAALGTAATAAHFDTLFRYCPEVICCFDGDQAGRTAAWRALNHAIALQREGKQVRFLFLPEGEDPDSLVRQEGKEAFEQRVSEQSLALSDYLFRELESQCDMASLDGRARMAGLAKPIIAKASDPVFKALLEQTLNERIGLQVTAAPVAAPTPTPQRRPVQKPRPLTMTPMRTVIALLLQHPAFVDQIAVEQEPALSKLNGAEVLLRIVGSLRQQPGISTGALLSLFANEPYENSLHQLAGWEIQGDEAAHAKVFVDALKKLLIEANEATVDPEARLLEARMRAGLASAEEKARFIALLQKKS
ncbi:DNA primase [Permianibacter aggregans]|uniref:DNA primase n=1 Tax=Permianibacter aggregans TaxID=1510150 RepID=A0A4R6UWE3_9GAMM|nr:DNA primase [Permianibacter aggregans]QGX39439.1 DNA primase [Permianibacter aggregans]TDQ49825.1 DNA primase [Permianibacter aggregans]